MQKDLPWQVLSAAEYRTVTLVACGAARTRAAIARTTGLARSTVGQQVDHLLRVGIFEEVEPDQPVRGRPPRVLTLGAAAGIIGVADIAPAMSRIAIADPTRRVLGSATIETRIDAGPEAVLSAVTTGLRELLRENDRDEALLRQLVVGLPGPVDFHHGCAVRPPIMPGWDGYPVAAAVSAEFGAQVTVDNDVNLAALGEATADRLVTAPLLFIRVATGIGAGLVTSHGTVHRGADGAAGDIGHLPAPGHEDVLCGCGKMGCIESVASYRAILRDLGIPETQPWALAERISHGDAKALQRIRTAAEKIGHVLAMLVHTYNPRKLVLGGPLSEIRDELLSGVRAVVYQQALPLATRKLIITTSELGADAGVHGGIALGAANLLQTNGIAGLLPTATGTGDAPATV